MAKWFYIEAIVTNAEVGDPGAIRFRSRVVTAPNEDEAYAAGARATRGTTYSPETETVNDYVLPVAEVA
jgi:hypothetical protein